jgi:hypothetical protein
MVAACSFKERCTPLSRWQHASYAAGYDNLYETRKT